MIKVLKRTGEKEELDVDKIHKVLTWSCEGLNGVSVSEIELNSKIQFYNGITTKDIHEILIRSAADLISVDNPNYQYVAGRLINYQLRKEVYNQYDPIDLKTHWTKVAELGYYDKELSDFYSEEEWSELNSYIDHNRDYDLAYVGMEQLRSKYLTKNRVTGEIFETPQMAFMLIAMTLFGSYKEDKLKWVKDLYDCISNLEISLPTPIMAGVRTPERQFSSCVLVESDDSLDSINATTSAIVKYVSQKAGLGIGAGRIRAEGSKVRNGSVRHTGVIPFLKLFRSAVKSCSQGGVRSGSATVNLVMWHKEIEDLLVLKNNKGTDDNRIRDLDYTIHINDVLYERLIENGKITLFSPSDVPGLFDAYYEQDSTNFRQLYEKYEKSTKIPKKVVSAYDLFSLFMKERVETGRIYFVNVNNFNSHSSYKLPCRISNLCKEISGITKPLKSFEDPEGEIMLCTLASINIGKIKKIEDFEKPCTVLVRALNALLDYQSYPVVAAELATKKRRPLGIGIINLAYWLVKNGSSYQNPNLELFHEYMEAWSYYLIKASVDLAEEFGACPGVADTKYYDGLFPIDTYKKDVDDLVSPKYKMDWNTLRERMLEFGIYNSSLMAQAPTETSAQVSNSTNGVEPPRSLVSVKQSKDGVFKQVVPEVTKYKNKYDLLWDQKSPRGYLSLMAVLQKFIDQSISTNTSYNPEHYGGSLDLDMLLGDLLWMYKYGLKTGYYHNTFDGAGEIEVKDEEVCESCTI